MNIYSNVEKENTSKKFMLIIVSLLLIGSAYAVYQANLTASVPINVGARMTEAEKIKQVIREKEHLKDQFAEAGRESAEEGDFDKSKDMADKVGILTDEIRKLYDDLHEANVREGVNGETK